MIPVFAGLLAIHALIHLMGFAKAFALVDLPQFSQRPAPAMGLVWLAACLLFLASAAALFVRPSAWWIAAAAAVVLSQLAIAGSWSDARFGTVANAIALVGVVFGFLTYGPDSLHAQYERDVARALAHTGRAGVLGGTDLAPLPEPVQRYLRVTGAIGRPRPLSFRIHFRGRIRSDTASPWMPCRGEQVSVLGDSTARLFYMDATRTGVPLQGYHRFVGPDASMRIKLAALAPVVDARGPEMDQSETVTMLNDMCVMAPGSLVDPRIRWRTIDVNAVEAAFTLEGRTVRAVLTFDPAGHLVDFVSDDRDRASADGRSSTRTRWSTPLRDYRRFGAATLAAYGEGRWHPASGEFAYLEFNLRDITYDVGAR